MKITVGAIFRARQNSAATSFDVSPNLEGSTIPSCRRTHREGDVTGPSDLVGGGQHRIVRIALDVERRPGRECRTARTILTAAPTRICSRRWPFPLLQSPAVAQNLPQISPSNGKGMLLKAARSRGSCAMHPLRKSQRRRAKC